MYSFHCRRELRYALDTPLEKIRGYAAASRKGSSAGVFMLKVTPWGPKADHL